MNYFANIKHLGMLQNNDLYGWRHLSQVHMQK
jgi:hypothetical protein